MELLSVFLALGSILASGHAAPLNDSLPWKTGRCELERQRCSDLIGSYCPQCDRNGDFLPKQCWGSTGYCWCVDVLSGRELPNTRTPPGADLKCRECQASVSI